MSITMINNLPCEPYYEGFDPLIPLSQNKKTNPYEAQPAT